MSEKKQTKKFRTAFGGGYQKADVNAYIESAQAQFQSIETTLKGTINHQKLELDALRQTAEEAERAIAEAGEMREALENARATLSSVQAQLTSVTGELSRVQEEKNTAEAALAASRAQTETLRAELAAFKEAAQAAEGERKESCCDDLKWKAEQYDKMSAEVGAVMLKANAGAEEVLSRARADAQAMLDGVNAELTETRARAQYAADHLIEDVSRSVWEVNRTTQEEIGLELGELRAALDGLVAAVEHKYTEIGRKLEFAKDEMAQTSGTLIRTATAPRVLRQDK
ncbi:MAG: hypothetical protein J6S41_03885 [Clostridia bacterium]|nr:hypothetical protein [Clostridia bacterium]MBO5670667.1 hypothetical protein [Clostridia bacterium]